MQKRVLRLFSGIVVLVLASRVVQAGTNNVTCNSTGTTFNVPIDTDKDSCFTAPNGATDCSDTSRDSNFSATCDSGSKFTGRSLTEYDAVPGEGCNIMGKVAPGMASCFLDDTNEPGCKFKTVGGDEVDTDSTGDMLFLTTPFSDVCIDLSSGPPFKATAIFGEKIIEGTGKNAGATGTRNGLLIGQLLTLDAAGHGLSTFSTRFTDTITTP
jgi:hypothetical protein